VERLDIAQKCRTKPRSCLLRHVQNCGFKRALLQGFCVLGLTRIKHLGRIFVNNKALAALAFVSGLLSATSALADQPHPWQIDLQQPATSLMEEARWFNHYTLWFIVPITLLVLVLLLIVMFRFRKSANPVPSKTSHNTLIEIDLDRRSGDHPAVLRRSVLPVAHESIDPAGKPRHHGQGHRHPVEVDLRISLRREWSILRFAHSRRTRIAPRSARRTRRSIRAFSRSTTSWSFPSARPFA
jgi:hypothetical protein